MKKVLFLAFIPFLTIQSNAVEDLDQVLNSLSDNDRKIVIDIKQEILTWPKKVRDEVKEYQDFIITLRAEADDRYNALSPEAKNALKKEEQITSTLSPEAIKKLEDIANSDMSAAKIANKIGAPK
jgi:predicted  nucleic acid-binding Zn-ribbon protein